MLWGLIGSPHFAFFRPSVNEKPTVLLGNPLFFSSFIGNKTETEASDINGFGKQGAGPSRSVHKASALYEFFTNLNRTKPQLCALITGNKNEDAASNGLVWASRSRALPASGEAA